jgi:sulfonate transport system substrate-binding protein
LTEAAVAAIANRGGFRILGLYTETPLLWGIHVPAASALSVESDIRGTRYAISRRGSGSHLMSYAHARAKAWPTERLDFVTVGSLDGAVTAFERGDASVFFWEKFMTQPLVDAGAFRRVGEYAAPWPAFVVCVADHAWREHRESIEELVHAALAEAQEFHSSGDAAQTIAARFALTLQAAQAWLGITRWSDRLHVEHDIVDGVARVLSEVDLIENRPNIQWFTRDRRE